MAKVFATTVHGVSDDDHSPETFKAGQKVPAWAAKALKAGGWKDDREDLWADDGDEDGDPTNDAAAKDMEALRKAEAAAKAAAKK